MVADDGHNTLVDRFCTPSNPFFEADLAGQQVWLFPPLELIGITIKFILNQACKASGFKCCLLVPERSSAHWFRSLKEFKRIQRYPPGSDLFRVANANNFVPTKKVKEYWTVIAWGM